MSHRRVTPLHLNKIKMSSFVIYFDKKRYMFERLLICGNELWSPFSILCMDSIFGEEQRDDQLHAQLLTDSVLPGLFYKQPRN